MEPKKITIMQELIFEGILKNVPNPAQPEGVEVDKGKILCFASMAMTRRKDSGAKGGVDGTKGWVDFFSMPSKDLSIEISEGEGGPDWRKACPYQRGLADL